MCILDELIIGLRGIRFCWFIVEINFDEKGCWFIEGGMRDWFIVWLIVWLMDWLVDFIGLRIDCFFEMCKFDILVLFLIGKKDWLLEDLLGKFICRNIFLIGNIELYIIFGVGIDVEMFCCDRNLFLILLVGILGL